MNPICKIEVVKDGRFFTAIAYLGEVRIKEYKGPVFEDVLTELVIDLQDVFEEKN